MISITRLLCDAAGPGDYLRYEKRDSPRPIVVWNCTRQCNLRCVHCYASAGSARSRGELNAGAARRFIDGLADFGVPVILFSGGEPLMREDLFELAEYARGRGLRLTLSTNGTLIDRARADRLKALEFAEVGISLDGIGEANDRFRGKKGAYQETLAGIRNCVAAGLRVSVRLTMTRFNVGEIPGIFRLIEEEKVDRVCFYHLAYSGRADGIRGKDLPLPQTRMAVDQICEYTLDLAARGLKKEVLTVGNHADGVYLYLKARQGDPERAGKIMELLRLNGGNNSGIRIGAVDDRGNVHPDQFWWHHSLGSILERPFGEIWMDTSEPVMRGLKDRKPLLKGRCRRCHFLDICNGNLRERAETVFGDVWAEDPACYLTEEEIIS